MQFEPESESEFEFEIRKSERIMNKNKLVIQSFCYRMKKYIDLINLNISIPPKIYLINNMYEHILQHFDIIMKSYYYTSFLNSVIKKGIEIKQIPNLVSNKFINIFSQIEKKYIDNFLPNNKKKSNNNNATKNICPICLDDISNNKLFVTNCNHCFHTKCLFVYFIDRNSCPICRNILKKIDNPSFQI
jgi:hypothetical protein